MITIQTNKNYASRFPGIVLKFNSLFFAVLLFLANCSTIEKQDKYVVFYGNRDVSARLGLQTNQDQELLVVQCFYGKPYENQAYSKINDYAMTNIDRHVAGINQVVVRKHHSILYDVAFLGTIVLNPWVALLYKTIYDEHDVQYNCYSVYGVPVLYDALAPEYEALSAIDEELNSRKMKDEKSLSGRKWKSLD